MFFERKSYLEQLISAEGNGMIKVITGIRRCGKSYLLFNIYRDHLLERGIHEDHIIQVNLEDRRHKKLRDPDALLEHIDKQMTDKDMYYILLDEIQFVPEFEDVLNSYLNVRNAEVFVIGSNAKFLSKDVITEFRGRGWEIRIHPLSFAEYYEAVGGEKAVALEEYYLYGGLPQVAQMGSPEDKENYLREIFETVYLKDVVEAYPDLPIIDTYEYVEQRVELPKEEESEHDHEEHGHVETEEHHHGANSHIWMNEDIHGLQTTAIAEGLGNVDSANADMYNANANKYVGLLSGRIDKQGVDEELAGANVAILHEAFEYTAMSLGANVVATMDLDEERQVSAGEVSNFIDSIKENDVKVVFAEYDYGNAMGKLITEQTDAKVVYLETLVHGDYTGLDYITVLNKNYAAIRNTF